MPDLLGYAVADAHIPEKTNAGAWAGLDEIRNDSVHALGQVAALCLDQDVPLFMAGDNFDGPDPEPGSLAAVYGHLRQFDPAGLKVYYVLGNHDAGRDWLAPLGRLACNVSGRVVKTTHGHTVTGLSYVPTAEEFVAKTAQAPRADVGLYHQGWSELTGGSPYSVAQLPDHGLSVCGDIHVRAVLDKPQHPRKILSPGPLSPQSVAEFFPPAVYAVYTDLSVREVAIVGRKFLRYDVASPEDAESVMQAVAGLRRNTDVHEDLSRPMVAVRLDAHVEGFVEAVEAMAASRGVVVRMCAGKSRTASAADTGRRAVMADLAAAIYSHPDVVRPAKELAVDLVRPGADLQDVIRKHEEFARADQTAVR